LQGANHSDLPRMDGIRAARRLRAELRLLCAAPPINASPY
jgi:CheY-like chemotaxis protein